MHKCLDEKECRVVSSVLHCCTVYWGVSKRASKGGRRKKSGRMSVGRAKTAVVLLIIGIFVGGGFVTWYFNTLPRFKPTLIGSRTTQPKIVSRRRPKIQLPAVSDILQKSAFDKNWTENEDLARMRKFAVVENIPDVDVLNTYNQATLSALFHSYLDNTDIRCKRKLRMGKIGDGGWEICDDYEWRPIRPCVVYSFGIDNDFSFDDDAGKLYGCDVYSFDPSMVKQPEHYRRSGRVVFYRLGIGGQSGPAQKLQNGWVLHSLSNIRAMLNHTETVIDVLKMDVESAEWSALPTMIKEGQLSSVRQLLIEYHQTSDDPQTLRNRLKTIGDVERAGFKRFYVHKNIYNVRGAAGVPIPRTSCYEIHYVNSELRRKV